VSLFSLASAEDLAELATLLVDRPAPKGTVIFREGDEPDNLYLVHKGQVALARHGRVHTFVVNQTMPAPFVAPLPIVVLDMDDGARLMLQAIGDGSDIEIGRQVVLVLRKYAHERGVPVYGFKAQPKKEVAP